MQYLSCYYNVATNGNKFSNLTGPATEIAPGKYHKQVSPPLRNRTLLNTSRREKHFRLQYLLASYDKLRQDNGNDFMVFCGKSEMHRESRQIDAIRDNIGATEQKGETRKRRRNSTKKEVNV